MSLMWESFAQFIDMPEEVSKENAIEEHEYMIFLTHATKLRQLLSETNQPEFKLKSRLKDMLNFLSKGFVENENHVLPGGAKTDLTLLSSKGEPYVNIELKVELGAVGRVAVHQNILYFVHAH